MDLFGAFSDDVPTAAVALTPKGPELIVNPLFFIKELKTKERVAVIKHEALHIIFRHLYRKPKKNADLELFNIAADLVVNQLIEPWPLPETGVTLKTFPDYDLRADQTVEWYYDKLLKLKKAAFKRTTINLEIIIVAAETVTVTQLTKQRSAWKP